MSLAIDIDTVVKVCVAGEWHDVKLWHEGYKTLSSFYIDAYEYVTHLAPGEWPPLHTEHGGGEYGICAAGFSFVDEATGLKVSGPLTSIDAVMNDPSLSKTRTKEPSVNGSSD